MADIEAIQEQVREFARERTERLAEEFVETAKGFAPRRTGAGADSIKVDSITEHSYGFTARVVVGEEYMRYQNFGTGVYGPRGRPIRAKTGHNGDKLLWFDSAILGIISVREVKGTEPTHFWERAVDEWSRIVGSVE